MQKKSIYELWGKKSLDEIRRERENPTFEETKEKEKRDEINRNINKSNR